jgi:hypothetical protein
MEMDPIKANHAPVRGQPEIPILGLNNIIYRVLRQSLLDFPNIHFIPGDFLMRVQGVNLSEQDNHSKYSNYKSPSQNLASLFNLV